MVITYILISTRARLQRLRLWLALYWRRCSPTYRHQCLKCGFLAFEKGEAPQGARRLLAAKVKAGWWSYSVLDAPVQCAKQLWEWNADVTTVLLTESNRPRFRCGGFYPWVPGRSLDDHRKLEDEHRMFRHQRSLAFLGLIGALIGAALTLFLKRP
jgi:hypothetical protein